VDVAWDQSPSTDVQGYKVYRSQISGGPYTLVSGTIPASTLLFTDSSVLSGKTYFYVVTSIDINGLESERSVEASAQIPP
jgi:fibronectin type 3 domain-containing protein